MQNWIASVLEGIRTRERAGCAREKEVAGSREETSPGVGMHLAGRPRSCRWSREAEETSPAPRRPTPLASVEQGGIEVAAAESSPGATASRWGCVPREMGSGDGGPKEQGRGLRCRLASGR
jgi:hypothetical protein